MPAFRTLSCHCFQKTVLLSVVAFDCSYPAASLRYSLSRCLSLFQVMTCSSNFAAASRTTPTRGIRTLQQTANSGCSITNCFEGKSLLKLPPRRTIVLMVYFPAPTKLSPRYLLASMEHGKRKHSSKRLQRPHKRQQSAAGPSFKVTFLSDDAQCSICFLSLTLVCCCSALVCHSIASWRLQLGQKEWRRQSKHAVHHHRPRAGQRFSHCLLATLLASVAESGPVSFAWQLSSAEHCAWQHR